MKLLDTNHARNTFLAGLFAVIPLAVTGYLIYLVEANTAEITRQVFGRYVPLVGAIIVLMLVYLLGMIVRSVFGKWILRTIDRIITRIPVLKELYNAWKQISFTHGGGEGMYAKVVLIPAGGAQRTKLLGFTSGVVCAPGSTMLPVFVPNVPNPILGRIYFVDQADVVETPLSTDEAFKILLSSANYVPYEITQQMPAVR